MNERPKPEDTLAGMFEFMGTMNPAADIAKMLSTLILNTQINMLKQMRREIDDNIRVLTQEGAEKMEYDEELDPYKILGVEQASTKEEIDRAFKAKAREAHPDRGGSNADMVKVNAAYEAIKQFRNWK